MYFFEIISTSIPEVSNGSFKVNQIAFFATEASQTRVGHKYLFSYNPQVSLTRNFRLKGKVHEQSYDLYQGDSHEIFDSD